MFLTRHYNAALCGALLLAISPVVQAETVCTFVPRPAAPNIETQQFVNLQSLQQRTTREFIELGDSAAADGRLAEAAYQFARVFEPHSLGAGKQSYSRERCAGQSVYREAAAKLKEVASRHATALMARGHYVPGGSPDEVEELTGGALYLFLISNDYEAFVENSLQFAASELRHRDVRSATSLLGIANRRLDVLESVGDVSGYYASMGWHDDTSPMLDEELAGIDKLKGFSARLDAKLDAMYPALTDYWLDEEFRRYRDLTAKESDVQRELFADYAIETLEIAKSRLSRPRSFPAQLSRIVRRGNERGEELMARQQYALARVYFAAIDNEERHAKADELAIQQKAAALDALKKTVAQDVQRMQKSDEEQAEFEDETEDMATEFGFDIED